MTISYNWLLDYLPAHSEGTDPAYLSNILTAIGLEVESLENYEEIKGGLKGLVVGEVITCEKHPDADKLKVTTVSVNNGNPLKIVCGAANVAAGQKVIVATVGTILYPTNGEPFTIKKAKIRGVESEGMICAQDEIGLGTDHSGIMVLPADTNTGTPVASLFQPKEDHIFEIGLTPNRIDAMSHLGVAKDICAYLSHHQGKEVKPVLPYPAIFTPDNNRQPIQVTLTDTVACRRYSGISISNINITESPEWLKDKLKSIGLKPINNIVDITNFILHETGQPLHAFDADKINGNKVIVRMASEGEIFTTLDGKERKLSHDDLLICDESAGMCLAGIYGGLHSGVTAETKNIFLESAWFNPATIRKSSLKHNLRTDAAARFEKGTDISNTVNVLARAALLIRDIAGGEISGDVIDIYPQPLEKTAVTLLYSYLVKLSGKKYPPHTVKNILTNLGFGIVNENTDGITVTVPYSKPDISLPADIVEEIMRIDGLDNIEIPGTITISPAVEKNSRKYELQEKLAGYLTGLGYHEIFTNSITNSGFYDAETLATTVKMINSLSAELNIMRPEMLQGGLQVIAHNNNRKVYDLKLYEFGKTYASKPGNEYRETMHLGIFATGNSADQDWKQKARKTDFYYLKGTVENVLTLMGISGVSFSATEKKGFINCTDITVNKQSIGYLAEVSGGTLKQFDLKQPVFYADLLWEPLLELSMKKDLQYREISKFPAVVRDLSIVVEKNIPYAQIKKLASSADISALKHTSLFDIFESEKLGAGKKAMAISFTFMDETKTLTDVEIDGFMQKLITSFEKGVSAEIRK